MEFLCPHCHHQLGTRGSGLEMEVKVICSAVDYPHPPHCPECGLSLTSGVFEGWYVAVLPSDSIQGIPYTQLEEIEGEDYK